MLRSDTGESLVKIGKSPLADGVQSQLRNRRDEGWESVEKTWKMMQPLK